MKNLITLFLLVVMTCTAEIHAQYIFQKHYVFQTSLPAFNSVKQTADGGFIVGGGPRSTSNQDGMFLMKVNAMGDTTWTRTLKALSGTQNSQRINAVDVANDGTYYMGGWTSGIYDFCVARVDMNGDTLWTRNLDHPLDAANYCYSAQVTSDNNFVTFGRQGLFEVNYYLNKWDTLGNIIWSKFYSIQNSHDYGNSVHQTSDGGYIMAGVSQNNNVYKTLVVKVDSTGNIQWAKTYTGNGEDDCKSVRQTSDGGYLIAGSAAQPNNTFLIFVLKADAAGDTLWTRTYDIGISAECYAMNLTSDNGFVITGRVYENNVYLLPIIKLDSLGNVQWSKNYGSLSYGSIGYDVIQTNDGGFMACGYTNESGEGGYLIKTDQFGNSGCNEYSSIVTTGYASFQVASANLATGNNALVKFPPYEVGSGVTLTNFCFGVDVEEPELKSNALSIFPNPTSDKFNFEHVVFEGYVTIYNIYGEKIYEQEIKNPSTQEISISNFKPGIYLVKWFDGSTISFTKMIKL